MGRGQEATAGWDLASGRDGPGLPRRQMNVFVVRRVARRTAPPPPLPSCFRAAGRLYQRLMVFLIVFLMSLAVSFGVSHLVANSFLQSVDEMLKKMVFDEMRLAWLKYVKYAIYVGGVASGVRIAETQKYVNQNGQLSAGAWVREIYVTVIEALKGILWILLLFLAIGLIAYIVLRVVESRHEDAAGSAPRR